MSYLVIAHPTDECAQRVTRALRQHSQRVFFTFDALAEQALFSWELTTQRSWSSVTVAASETLRGETLDGVFVRTQGGPASSLGWTSEAWTYVQAEGQAALLAWLSSLPCPVVNRLTADLWFRPHRSYPEWRTLFRQSGLPTLAVQITNDLRRAQDFSRCCGGAVTYTPLTSDTQYAIRDDAAWRELAKVLKIVPVCLVESGAGPANLAWLVGRDVFWAALPDCNETDRRTFERGIRHLAVQLSLATFEVQLRCGTNGPCCAGINLYPRLESYDASSHEAIVSGIVLLLGAEA